LFRTIVPYFLTGLVIIVPAIPIVLGILYQAPFSGISDSKIGIYSGRSEVIEEWGSHQLKFFTNELVSLPYQSAVVSYSEISNSLNVTLPSYLASNRSLPMYFAVVAPVKNAYFAAGPFVGVSCSKLVSCTGVDQSDGMVWSESLIQGSSYVVVNQTHLDWTGFRLVINLSKSLVARDEFWGDAKLNFTFDANVIGSIGISGPTFTPNIFWENLLSKSTVFTYYGRGFSELNPTPLAVRLSGSQYTWNLTNYSAGPGYQASITGSSSGQTLRDLWLLGPGWAIFGVLAGNADRIYKIFRRKTSAKAKGLT
jgi:hypothetical protein